MAGHPHSNRDEAHPAPAPRRFFLPPESCNADLLVLEGREARHAAQVIRLRPGDLLTVLNGRGDLLDCEVQESRHDRLALRVLVRRHSPPPPCPIMLIQAVPRGRVMDDIVTKATELGASRVIPVLTARTVVHLDDSAAGAKSDKWLQSAVEAVKQCGNPWLPRVDAPVSFDSLIAQPASAELSLVCALTPDSTCPGECIRRFIINNQRPPRSVSVWIGPEGDFTPEELGAIRAAGAHAITLGPLVLRADTAATSAIAIIGHELRRKQDAV